MPSSIFVGLTKERENRNELHRDGIGELCKDKVRAVKQFRRLSISSLPQGKSRFIERTKDAPQSLLSRETPEAVEQVKPPVKTFVSRETPGRISQVRLVAVSSSSEEKSNAMIQKKPTEGSSSPEERLDAIVRENTMAMPMLSDESPENIAQVKTIAMPALSRVFPAIEQMMARLTPVSQLEMDDSLVLQTVSIQAVTETRKKTTLKMLFINLLLFLAGLLFIGAILAVIMFVPYPIFKIAAFVVLLIVISHFISLQIKRIYRVQQQKFLTTTQIIKAIHKEDAAPEEEEDMKHLSLIKQDTMTYLQALKQKDLKGRRVRRS